MGGRDDLEQIAGRFREAVDALGDQIRQGGARVGQRAEQGEVAQSLLQRERIAHVVRERERPRDAGEIVARGRGLRPHGGDHALQ